MRAQSYKPAHGGYCDPHFAVPDLLGGVRLYGAPLLRQCDAILGLAEQQVIEECAQAAHEGRHIAAERMRTYANYANLKFRPDADSRSGII